MKIQLAYRFTGEDTEKLLEELKKIKVILEAKGHEVYIPVLDLDKPEDKKELYLGTLDKINNTDIFLALIKSEDRSEGMLMEIGHAFGAGKKIIAAINNTVNNTHLREFAEEVIEFNDIEDLYNKLEGFEF